MLPESNALGGTRRSAPGCAVCDSGRVTGNDARYHDPHPSTDAAQELALEELEHRKDDLRQALLARRRQLDQRFLDETACAISRQTLDLTASLGLRTGDTVAAYVSTRGEPGMLPTLQVLRDAGLEVLLPVLGPALQRQWGRFTRVEDLAQRAPNRPLEPEALDGGAQVLERARLVLVPALAVDDDGVRLGRGGGWYDRTLRHVDPEACVSAVVYDEEAHHPLLPRAEHDVPVGGVLTPGGWWRITPPVPGAEER